MKTIKHENYIELVADKDKYLTQAKLKETDAKIYTDSVCLGKEDSVSNWREADKSEKEEWEAGAEQRMHEAMQKQMQEQQEADNP